MIKAFTQTLGTAWRAVKEVIFSISDSALFDRISEFSARWSSASYRSLARLAVRNPYASRAIYLIASNMASVPLHVERETATGEVEEIVDHPIHALLERPNPRHSRTWFFHAMVYHLMAAGEFFLLPRGPETGPNAGTPRQLHLIRPDRFQEFEEEDVTDIITGYWFTGRDGTGRDHFTIDEVLHAFTFNPLDPDRGLPILLAALRAMDKMASAAAWNKGIAEGGGQIPGWFKPLGLEEGQQLTTEQQKAAEKALQRMYRENAKAGRPGVLSGAFDFVKSVLSPKDAEFLEGDQLDARKIGIAIGIDPSLLGDPKTKTFANMRTALRTAFILTILPVLDFILDELNAWLMPKFGVEGAMLTYHKRDIEALQEDAGDRFERLSTATGTPWMTPDEARHEIGLEPMGIEDVFLPFNVRPADQLTRPEDMISTRHLQHFEEMDEDAFEELLAKVASNGNGNDHV